MDFLEIARNRYSCRDFDRNKEVSRHTLSAIIEAARLAPSACNRQPWMFVIIDEQCDPTCRQTIIESYNRPWVETAPAFIVACGDHSQAWHRPADGKDHTDVDLAIAIEHICLAATAVGLGTCWVCNFDVEKLSKGLNIPSQYEPIAIIPIGYPTTEEACNNKNRKELDDIIKWGNF